MLHLLPEDPQISFFRQLSVPCSENGRWSTLTVHITVMEALAVVVDPEISTRRFLAFSFNIIRNLHSVTRLSSSLQYGRTLSPQGVLRSLDPTIGALFIPYRSFAESIFSIRSFSISLITRSRSITQFFSLTDVLC